MRSPDNALSVDARSMLLLAFGSCVCVCVCSFFLLFFFWLLDLLASCNFFFLVQRGLQNTYNGNGGPRPPSNNAPDLHQDAYLRSTEYIFSIPYHTYSLLCIILCILCSIRGETSAHQRDDFAANVLSAKCLWGRYFQLCTSASSALPRQGCVTGWEVRTADGNGGINGRSIKAAYTTRPEI